MARDISRRILGRSMASPFAPAEPAWRRLRWLVWIAAAWLVYSAFLSDRSFFRIARLRHELATANAEVERIGRESGDLEARMADPKARQRQAEKTLRERTGMARPDEMIYVFRKTTPRDTVHP